jgi:SAM-dependent methyltransferase
MSTPTLDHCVACGSDALDREGDWHGYELRACRRCGLSMTANPDYSRDRYVAAYAGDSDAATLPAEHAHIYTAPERRLALELSARLVPPPYLTPAERRAVAWIERHGSRDGAIVDCGCGTGRFLRALKRRGIPAHGFELSPALVTQLQAAGLDVAQGAAPDFPWTHEPPFAITFFEVLEHLPDPAAFLAPLRARFPGTHVLASVPSPTRVAVLKGNRQPVDYPPNHFLRWTPLALDELFRGLGYGSVRVQVPAPTGSEVLPGATAAVRRLLRTSPAGGRPRSGSPARGGAQPVPPFTATAAVVGGRAYQGLTSVVGLPLARRWAARGASASSMLVIASP